MSRRPGPRIERTRATGGGEEDPTSGDTETSEEDGEDGIGDDITSSIGDLVGGADPNRFDRTFLVEKEDIPAAPTEPWPVPQPWQGLPRLAFVVNINYVYDDEEEQWVRQRPFEGGGVWSVVEEGTFSNVPNQTIVTQATNITDPTRNVVSYAWLAAGQSPGTDFGTKTQGDAFNNVDTYDLSLAWDDANGKFDATLFLDNLGGVDIEYYILELDA